MPSILLAGLLALAAADPVVVEDWRSVAVGATGVPKGWRTYGGGGRDFKHPPTIVRHEGHLALRLQTDHYSIRLGKGASPDLARTPVVEWEWNVQRLPRHGDVRSSVNDQAARLLILLGSRIRPDVLGYIWDTKAPTGTEIRSSGKVDRWLVVIRSGSDGLGRWHRESRNVARDYTRLFGKAAPSVVAIGLESHSEDADHESQAMFGTVKFRP